MIEAQKTSKTAMLEVHNSWDDRAWFLWSSNFFHLEHQHSEQAMLGLCCMSYETEMINIKLCSPFDS